MFEFQGAGKGHTMNVLASENYFPLRSYVSVDPDEIRQQFPEFHLYATRSRANAGERTHKEAGYVTEITTRVALDRGYNVLVDGSLRDWAWYAEYFKKLKREYKKLRIAIIYVSAPREIIFERAKVSLIYIDWSKEFCIAEHNMHCHKFERNVPSKLVEWCQKKLWIRQLNRSRYRCRS